MKAIVNRSADKAGWDLIPWDVLHELAILLALGRSKHGKAWKKRSRDESFAKALRHVSAWRMGEKTDFETGQSHLVCAIANLVFLRASESGLNDKY